MYYKTWSMEMELFDTELSLSSPVDLTKTETKSDEKSEEAKNKPPQKGEGVQTIDPSEDTIIDLLDGEKPKVDDETDKSEEPKDKNEVQSPSEQSADSSKFPYSTFAKALYEEGVLSFFEEDEFKKLSEELGGDVEALIELNKRTIVDQVDAYKNSLTAEAQEFLDALEKGVPLDKYIQNKTKEHSYLNITEDKLTDNDELCKKILREDLELRGYTEDEINDMITDTDNLGKLKSKATLALKKLQETYKMDGLSGSSYLDPKYRLPKYATFGDEPSLPHMQPIGFDGFNVPSMPNNIGKVTQAQITKPTTSVTPTNNWWSDIPLESRIGMISQLAGNLGQGILAATAGKPKKLDYNPITLAKPQMVSADEQLAEARRGYRGAMANMRYLSPSQYMAAMSDLATRSAAANACIIQNVENQNVEIMNRQAALEAENAYRNEERRIGIDQYNEAARQAYLGNIGNMIGGMSGTVAGGMRDLLGYKQAERNLKYTGSSNMETIRDPKTKEYINVTWVDGRKDLGTATRGTQKVYFVDGKEVEKNIFDIEFDKRVKR